MGMKRKKVNPITRRAFIRSTLVSTAEFIVTSSGCWFQWQPAVAVARVQSHRLQFAEPVQFATWHD